MSTPTLIACLINSANTFVLPSILSNFIYLRQNLHRVCDGSVKEPHSPNGYATFGKWVHNGGLDLGRRVEDSYRGRGRGRGGCGRWYKWW